MTRGGARVRSGPARDPAATRRRSPNESAGFIHLPASGREGDPPAWPLPGRMTAFERERWATEWRRPQALMWERLGLEVQVAIYVRTLGAATKPGARLGEMDNLLRLTDSLGLSVGGLAALRWIIDDDAAQAVPKRSSTSTAKDRLAVIRGGADARAS